MKKIILACATVLLVQLASHAQVSFSLGLNIGSQPAWGPTGYDHADYYYLPDVGAYYDVPQKQFVYRNGNNWTRSSNLPSQYRNFNLYSAHKVVINGDRNPYNNDARYRSQYGRYRGRNDQTPIRDSRDRKYFENPGHPMHSQWERDRNRPGHH